MNEYDSLIIQEQLVYTNTLSTWVVVLVMTLLGIYCVALLIGLIMWLSGRVALRKKDLDNDKIIKFNRIRKTGMILVAVCIVLFVGIWLFLEFGPKLASGNI
jgi:hypothetical protein